MKPMLAAALLAAAATSPLPAQQQPADAPAATACPTCGVVTSIRSVPLRGEPQWLGTIGATPGSSQPSLAIGAGRNAPPARDADAGARRRTVYEVVVQMDDQTTRKLHYEHRPALSVGDKVRVAGQLVYLR